MVFFGRPSPSVPMIIARRGSVFRTGSSSVMESSVNAIATVLKPSLCSDSMGASSQVQGIRKTLPIDTLTARRFRGSQVSRVRMTASIPKAAADRKIAPIFVVSVTPSMTTTRRASRRTSLTDGICFRRMAQRTPRVSVYPVSDASNSRLPVYIGIRESNRSMISLASPSICLRSQRRATGSQPASRATRITFGLSAIKRPFSGSSSIRSWASVSVLNIWIPGSLSDVISMMGILSYFWVQRYIIFPK